MELKIGQKIRNYGAENVHLRFAVAFVVIFAAAYIFLAVVGATPDPLVKHGQDLGGVPYSATSTQPENPTRIAIPSISLSATVSNPNSANADTLDNALLYGAVRYPTSAQLGAQGTVLLFGHSSYLPIVHNSAYKTFDGIQNLITGDEISIFSATKEYRYRVVGVRTANVSVDSIALPQNGQHLTLVTCDSFATKSDRFIVTADFVGTYSLTN